MRALTRFGLVAGPLLLLASTIAAATDQGVGQDALGGTIQLWAMVFLGIGLVGLARELEGDRPRVAATLTVMTFIGICAGAAFGVNGLWQEATGLTIEDEAMAGPGLYLPGLVFPLSMLAQAAARLRFRLGSTLPSVLLGIGAVLFPLSRIPEIDALALAADVFLLAGMVAIARELTPTESDPRVAA